MPNRIGNVTFDCADPDRQAVFWAEALGYVVQELPPDLAKQFDGNVGGESSLKGHLANPNDHAGAQDQSGSLAYVPPDPKDDKQLNYALNLLRGLQVNAAFPPDPNRAIPN